MQTWDCDDMDTYADDLAQQSEKLDLREVIAIALGRSLFIHLGQGDRICMSRLNQ